MRTLAALVVAILSGACAHGPASDVHRESEDPLLAFHLTRDEQASHLQSREFEGRRLYLERQPVISDPDILHVEAALRDDGVMLDVEFRPDAAERLQSITGDNLVARWRFFSTPRSSVSRSSAGGLVVELK